MIDDLLLPMPGITKGLGGSFVEIIVGKLGVQDFVAVLFPEGRLAATRFGGPAVQEKDFHDARNRLRFRAICSIS